jgi:hypothetical protein
MSKQTVKTGGSRIRELTSELEKRKMEVLSVFRPLDYQECIYECKSPEMVVLGGNRSGKTLNVSIRFASELLRTPVTRLDGTKIPLQSPNEPLLTWVIGKHENHLGTTIYDTLFRPGLFKVIRDLETGDWRTYRPWDPADVARKNETEPSEPLIPDRYIKEHAWQDKKCHVYEEVTLVNGNIIRFYSSMAEAKQGDKLDIIWIDEDIENEEHVQEWQARTVDKEGFIFWSAFPHSANAALSDMVDRAEAQEHLDDPYTSVIQLTMSQNPFLSKKRVKAVTSSYSEDQKRARDGGEFTFDSQLVYPEFRRSLHLSPPVDEEAAWDELDRILGSNERPSNWRRDMIVDPGFNNQAILFCAVVPEDLGGYLVVEDELYLKRKNLDQACQLIRDKMKGPFDGCIFESFIIDGHAARQTPMTGIGGTYRQQYVDAFKRWDISCRQTGNDFILGSDNVEGRINLVRNALAVDTQLGRPRLRFHRHRTKDGCQYEFARYKYQVVKHKINEKVVSRYDHAMDCLGYWVSTTPEYVYPEPNDNTAPRIIRQFRRLLNRSSVPNEPGAIRLGPSAA